MTEKERAVKVMEEMKSAIKERAAQVVVDAVANMDGFGWLVRDHMIVKDQMRAFAEGVVASIRALE